MLTPYVVCSIKHMSLQNKRRYLLVYLWCESCRLIHQVIKNYNYYLNLP